MRCREWTYALPFKTFQEWIRWLPRDMSIYHRLGNHSVLGWRSE